MKNLRKCTDCANFRLARDKEPCNGEGGVLFFCPVDNDYCFSNIPSNCANFRLAPPGKGPPAKKAALHTG